MTLSPAGDELVQMEVNSQPDGHRGSATRFLGWVSLGPQVQARFSKFLKIDLKVLLPQREPS